MRTPSDGPGLTPSSVPARNAASISFDTLRISGASYRLRALADLSGSLTDALGPKEAVDLVEQKALSALGATSGVVVTLGPFPSPHKKLDDTADSSRDETLHVVHAIGLKVEVNAALEKLPLNAPVPFAEVARTGEPVFLGSEAEMRRYPDWASTMIAAGCRAAAIVPVWANGELRGVLGLTWAAAHTFDEDERAFVLTLGVMCAQAIMRAYLRSAEREAREAAEQANLSKSNFVATIGHELRTPMNAVLGYTALLADEIYGPVSSLQKEHIGRVQSSGKHLLGLIEDLLSYARVEAGQETVHPERVLLVDVVEASLVLVRPLAEQKGLRVRVEGSDTPIEMHTDPRKLRQILINLLANAVKFTDNGDIVVQFRIDGTDAALTVRFEVTDRGAGMTEEVQSHIFEPFWQADVTAKKTSGSGGLGLSVARKLARLLGGDVTVSRSAPGQGSTFVVTLPMNYVAPVAEPAR